MIIGRRASFVSVNPVPPSHCVEVIISGTKAAEHSASCIIRTARRSDERSEQI
jgi:hypothetical protein